MSTNLDNIKNKRLKAAKWKNIKDEMPEEHQKAKIIVEDSTHAIYGYDGNYLDQLDITTFKCPVCNCILASGEIDITDCIEIHYCDNCGQALDWSVGKWQKKT